MSNSKVIIWLPFPSPTGKRKLEIAHAPSVPSKLVNNKPKTQVEVDAAAVQRWIELADIAIAKPPESAKKKFA